MRLSPLTPHLSNLTNILMLLPDDPTRGRSKKRNYLPGKRRRDLFEFLRCPNRKIADLIPFMAHRGFDYHHWNRSFTQDDRHAYFSSIPSEWLCNSLVFLDPDVGLVPDRVADTEKRKYLYYHEAQALYERMGSGVLVCYQHLQWDARKREGDTKAKAAKLAQALDADVVAVRTASEGDLAFLVAGKDQPDAAQVLEDYKQRLGLIKSSVK